MGDTHLTQHGKLASDLVERQLEAIFDLFRANLKVILAGQRAKEGECPMHRPQGQKTDRMWWEQNTWHFCLSLAEEDLESLSPRVSGLWVLEKELTLFHSSSNLAWVKGAHLTPNVTQWFSTSAVLKPIHF
ncbi:Hypothetical predicted protein [Pelobates cultripes]|uniref:Uncharacterized protein n=1 Tax=Pelobates cultripes TaxID=61616 RepID=A0AAD1W0V1_PELCU|nr:Hypothetical predicted protein [Pelobates cultripes]